MIRHPTILKSQVEGDLTIKQVEFLRLKRLTFYLVTIFSFGISSIVCYFNINLKKYFFYSTQNCIETSTHVLVQTTNDKFQIEKLNSQIKDRTLQTYFLNRKIKYFYDQSEHSFQALQLEIEGKKISEIAKSSPQDPQEIEQKIQLFGKSFIEIKVPSYFEYMGSQMFQPMNFIFYFGQLVLLLQLFYSFFAIALSAQIIIMSIIYIFVRKTKQQLKEACMHDLQVQVQRSNGIQTVSSTELVPGDIIIINQNITLPFDCILLEGQMQVNEANITGESIPVIKSPLPSNSDLTFKYENQKSQVLLEGTSIIKLEMDSAKALVVRTSLSSFKGQIIRALLYPKPFDKRFVLQGAKFSLLMVLFCSIAFFCVLYQYYNINLSNWQITLRYLDMIQFCVPPAVPIIINAMIFFGLMRLKTKNILGSDPMKQIQAGRIQTICFDKTGTLTENFVEIIGYSLPQHENLTIVGKDENSHSNEIIDKILGICHQASASDDQETIVGDPIDIQMVQFSGWTIGHDQEKKLPFASKKDNKLYSLLVNEFHSEFQSMSVVSQDTQKNKYYLFIKGSPEVIISRCHSQEQKEAYLQKLHQFAVKGYRVLGLGYKELSFDNLENFIKMQRSDQEKDICFSGFLIFKNNLKKDTKQVIEELKQAELKIKIISGDNPITTIKIAEECSILKDTNSIILLDHAKQQSEFLNIYEINEEGHKTEITFQGNQEQILQQQISFCVDSIKQNKSFCMTGSAQSFFQDRLQIPKEHAQGAIQQQSNQKLESFYKLLILHSQIFARTSPEQKALVVKQVKELGQNVCMVGDGANDCSAIREADIGISFSDADGQFSAPYISKYPSIECVKQILLEGRAVLQTSREIFKGYIQIGILRFMCFLALSYFYSGLGDFQMTWQGYIFGYTMNYILYGLSKPVKNLQKITIDDDFFGIHTLISMVFSLLVFSCQFVVILNILQDSPNYIPTTQLQSNGHLAIIGQENTLMFIAVLVNYLYIYLSNYRSSPIKQPIFKNYLFFISVLLQALYANIIIFTDKINVSSMNLKPIYDNDAEIKIFFSLHGFGMIIYLFDFIFTKNLFSKAYQKKRRFSSNNAQLCDFIEICNNEDGKIFNDMNLKEGYIKIKNAQVNNRIYAKSVTKRRTPISFKVRGSSCQKQREEDQQNLQLNQNYAYMKQDKDNYLQAEINNQNGQKQELCNIQTNGASKKLAVSPIQFDQEEQKDYKTNFSNRFKAHSPNKAIANSFVFKIQHDQVKNQARANLETSFKSNTETLRQNRVKNKVIDSSFLTGKREGNLGYNSTATTTSFANGRIKNSATPIIDVNDVNAIDQKAIQSINPKTLPFLSSDRGINQNNHFHFGEFKISTSKATELFQNNILPKTQKQSGNNSNNNQISQSVTATITYNSKDNNQGNTNKLSNLNRTKNNTICTNQNIIYKHNRYSSNTPSKRVKGVLINSVLSENQSNKETLQASNRNSQIRKRQQIIQKQNNILANSIQHIYSNLEENAGQLSKNRRINNTTNFDSTNFQTNENSEKAKQNQASNPIQQAINKQQFNKIFVNFSKLRREGQDLGKGFLGSILTNAPKHPIYNQISQRQKNSLNVESRIIKKEKDPNQNQHCNEDDLQYPKNSNKALEMVESLVQKINSQLNDLQVNLSIMKSSNKILLDAIEQKESTEIFHQIEKYTDTTTATSSSSSKQISKIQINKLIPLMKQCFDSTYDLSDPSTIAFLQTDNEDSEQEDKNSSRETKNEIKQNYNK